LRHNATLVHHLDVRLGRREREAGLPQMGEEAAHRGLQLGPGAGVDRAGEGDPLHLVGQVSSTFCTLSSTRLLTSCTLCCRSRRSTSRLPNLNDFTTGASHGSAATARSPRVTTSIVRLGKATWTTATPTASTDTRISKSGGRHGTAWLESSDRSTSLTHTLVALQGTGASDCHGRPPSGMAAAGAKG